MDPIKIILTQTTYTEEEAKALLEKENGDYMAVLKKFIMPAETTTKRPKKPLSYHQAKISLLRDALDDANERYRQKKESEETKEAESCE